MDSGENSHQSGAKTEGSPSGEVLETSTARVHLDGEGILWIAYKEHAAETLQTAKELLLSMEQLTLGEPRLTVIDIRHLKAVSREARTFWAEDHDGTSDALAVMVARGTSRAMGNFWLAINKPGIPTKLFTSDAEALSWLRAAPRGSGVPKKV